MLLPIFSSTCHWHHQLVTDGNELLRQLKNQMDNLEKVTDMCRYIVAEITVEQNCILRWC